MTSHDRWASFAAVTDYAELLQHLIDDHGYVEEVADRGQRFVEAVHTLEHQGTVPPEAKEWKR